MTAASAVLVLALGVPPATAADGEVTIASWGGSYQEAQSRALFQPASEATGIEVKEETYGGVSDVRLQVQTGAVTYDIVASGSGSAARAAAEGLLEELDYDVIDVSSFHPHLKTPHCVGGDVFSIVFAWNTETYGEEGPQTWADFWDVEKFPGRRAYRGAVTGALEPALMTDGVPPEEVYEVLGSEEGIERAIGLGLWDEPLKLVHNLSGTLIGMVHIMLPFLVLPLYGSMRAIDRDYLRAASSLGATPAHAFRTVFLPLSAPGLVAGSLMVFVLCLGWIRSTRPSPRSRR